MKQSRDSNTDYVYYSCKLAKSGDGFPYHNLHQGHFYYRHEYDLTQLLRFSKMVAFCEKILVQVLP